MKIAHYTDLNKFVGLTVTTNDRWWEPVRNIEDASDMLTYFLNEVNIELTKFVVQSNRNPKKYSSYLYGKGMDTGKSLYDLIIEDMDNKDIQERFYFSLNDSDKDTKLDIERDWIRPAFLLFVVVMCIIGTVRGVTHMYTQLTYEERRCPSYLEDEAGVYVENVEEFYDYVCTMAEANDIPAEWLLAAIHYHCRFNSDGVGILKVTESDLDVFDQMLSLNLPDVKSMEQLFRLTVDVDNLDDTQLTNMLEAFYPTAYNKTK